MKSYSSGVLKPDCVMRGLTKEIFSFLEKNGLTVVLKKELFLNEIDVKVIYEYCFGMTHYQSLLEFMMSGKVTFYVVQCDNENAISLLNKVVGFTNPIESATDTIRGMYGNNVKENIIHSTQDETTFLTEINHFLSEREKSIIFS